MNKHLFYWCSFGIFIFINILSFLILLLEGNNFLFAMVYSIVFCIMAYLIFRILYVKEKENKISEVFKKQQKWLETTLYSIGDGIIVTDINTDIILFNRTAEIISGYESKEVIGSKVSDILQLYEDTTDEKFSIKRTDFCEYYDSFDAGIGIYLLTKDREKKYVEITVTVNRHELTTYGYAIIIRDITCQKARKDEIIYHMYHDSLTGLYNRRYFNEELSKIDRKDNYPLSVVVIDLNGLKLMNDIFGHLMGDKFIEQASMILKNNCREEHIIVRYGGDEFVILMPKTSSEDAKRIIDRIKKESNETIVQYMKVSMAMGYATKTKEDEDINNVINIADNFMYNNKVIESRESKSHLVELLLSRLFERDPYEEKHSDRVSHLSKKIGEVMGLSKEVLNDLQLLGRIHDIGNIAIDTNILNKKSSFSNTDNELIKRHAEIGYFIVGASPKYYYLGNYVLTHHERYDGKGYPNRISGEDIPLLSRILCLADAYDSMVGERPYKESISVEDATKEIIRCKGTQFDPEVVDAFLRVMEKDCEIKLI
jgi:diguanylate cyclase (GGDEF)-like protein/PAS domain S-box-containing protein